MTTLRPLVEQIVEAKSDVQDAEYLYKTIPHSYSAIKYIEALDKLDALNEILESIMIEVPEEQPRSFKRKSFNKRKRNRKVAVL
jgi:hypothetical protein